MGKEHRHKLTKAVCAAMLKKELRGEWLRKDRLTNDPSAALDEEGWKENEGVHDGLVRTIELIIAAGRGMIEPDFTVLSY